MRHLFAALLLLAIPGFEAAPNPVRRQNLPAGVSVDLVTVTNPDGSLGTLTLPFSPGQTPANGGQQGSQQGSQQGGQQGGQGQAQPTQPLAAGVQTTVVPVTNPDGSVGSLTLPFVPGAAQTDGQQGGQQGQNSQQGQQGGGAGQPAASPTSALPAGVQTTVVPVTNPDGSVGSLTIPFVPGAAGATQSGAQPTDGQQQGGQQQPQPTDGQQGGGAAGQPGATATPTSALPAGVQTTVVPVTNPDGSVGSLTIPFVPGAAGATQSGAQPTDGQQQGGQQQPQTTDGQQGGGAAGQPGATATPTSALPAGVQTTVVPVTNPDGSVGSLTIPFVPGTAGQTQGGQPQATDANGQPQPSPTAGAPAPGGTEGQAGQPSQPGASPTASLPANIQTTVVPVTNSDGSVGSLTVPFVPGGPSGGATAGGPAGTGAPSGTGAPVPAGTSGTGGGVVSVPVPGTGGQGGAGNGTAGQGGAGNGTTGQGQGGTGTAAGPNPFTSPVPTGTPINGNYSGHYRPQIHYTPPIGFMNDPNGLFKDSKGVWHLYYQYNPSNITTGNQHWGHATSADGYKWENKPIAIFPPSQGVGVFSGSVVTDPNNTSGFFGNATGNDNVVAIYTLDYPESNGTAASQVQALSYSTDGGNTFTPFDGNPVLKSEQYPTAFRDPKVIRHGDKWVMAVAASDGHKVQFYTSDNLKNWNMTSEIGSDALANVEYECPNLVRVGDKWALILSTNPGGPYGGSTTHYWTGEFNGTHFTPANGNPKLAEWGQDGYAGQVFYPDGEANQTVYMNWANNWQYVEKTPTGEAEWWRGAMSVPRLLSIANGTDGEVLVQQPFNPDPVLGEVVTAAATNNGTLSHTFDGTKSGGSMLMLINVSNIPAEAMTPANTVNWTFFSADKKEWLESGYSFDGKAWIRRGKVGSFNAPGYAQNLNTTYPIPKAEGNGTAHISFAAIVDRSILETFIDGGKSVATSVFYANSSLTQFGVWAKVPPGVSVQATVFGLNSAWANSTNSTAGGAGGQQTAPQPQPTTQAAPPAGTESAAAPAQPTTEATQPPAQPTTDATAPAPAPASSDQTAAPAPAPAPSDAGAGAAAVSNAAPVPAPSG